METKHCYTKTQKLSKHLRTILKKLAKRKNKISKPQGLVGNKETIF